MSLSKQKSKSKTARVEKRFKWWKENKKKKENLSKTNVESSNTNQEHNDEGCQDTYNTKAHLHKNPKTSEKLGNILTKTDNVENTIKSPKNKMKKSLNNTTNTTKNTNNVDEKLPQTQPTLSDPTSNTISNKTKKQKLSKRQYVVFVGKLTKDTNSNDISKHFEPCGGVKEVRLLTDKGTGESRKCAYVELYDKQSHMGALKLNKSKLKGSSINVEFTSRGRKTFHRMQRLRHKNNTIASRFRNSHDYRKQSSAT